MFCAQCGNKISEESAFCENCGTKVKEVVTTANTQNTADVNNQAQTEACVASEVQAVPPPPTPSVPPVQPQAAAVPPPPPVSAPSSPTAVKAAQKPQFQAENYTKGKVVFSGKGGSIFFPLIGWYLLTMITLGIYGPWAYVKLKKFVLSNTTVNGKRLGFIGTGGQLWINILLVSLFTCLTFGIYMPWGYCKIERWFADNTIIMND